MLRLKIRFDKAIPPCYPCSHAARKLLPPLKAPGLLPRLTGLDLLTRALTAHQCPSKLSIPESFFVGNWQLLIGP